MEMFDYQLELVDQLTHHNNWALFVTPGAGKTLMSLELIRRQKRENVIILCRKNKIKEWEQDVVDFGLTLTNVCVINFESIAKLDDLVDLKNTKHFVLIDESQNIKSNKRSSKRWQKLQLLKRKGCSFGLLSGTPQHEEYLDYYTSLFLLDIYPDTVTAFKRQYCRYSRRPGQVYETLEGYNHKDQLNLLLQYPNIGWKHKESKHTPIFYDVEFKRLPLVQQVLKDRVYNDVLLDTPGKTALYELMMEACVLDGDILDTRKLEFILKQVLPKYDQVVLFTNYIAEVDYITDVLSKLNISHNVFTGSRKDDITEDVVIVNVNAGGSGMNSLADFDCAVFHSMPIKYIEMEQAIGRVDRIGQTKPPAIYFLMGPAELKKFKGHMKRRLFDDMTFNFSKEVK